MTVFQHYNEGSIVYVGMWALRSLLYTLVKWFSIQSGWPHSCKCYSVNEQYTVQ